jgi:hypothetical protein
VTPDQRLFVVFYVSGQNAAGRALSENRLMELLPGGTVGPAVRIPLKQPFGEFFTATVRGGSPPSDTIHLLGPPADSAMTIGYARIRVRP